jgi:hypothetical protein
MSRVLSDLLLEKNFVGQIDLQRLIKFRLRFFNSTVNVEPSP